MIEVTNLVKNYTTGSVVTKVLHGIDLSVQDGEFVSIMGKSGAGKSTLLYQMSLLDTPTSGSITISGTDIETLQGKERINFRLNNLGYVFQEYALLPDLNAEENVMLPLLMKGLSRADAQKTAQDALDNVGLAHRHFNRPSQLSGGEQQRVAVARAIAGKPTILFADEPTANLDTASGTQVIKILDQLNKDGQTIVMVTHEKEYAIYSDRIVHIEDGVIDKETTPNTL